MLILAFAGACGSGDGGPTGIAGQAGLRFLDRSQFTDTIYANYQRSVVMELRDDAGRPVAGAPISVSSRLTNAPATRAAAFSTLPVGQTELALTVITDAAGRAQFFMRLMNTAGAGFVVADAGAGRRDSIPVTVLPGQPITVTLTPIDTAMLVGRTVEMKAVGRDWGGNDAGRPIDLSVTSATIAVEGGKARGVAIGRAAVIASLGALRDTSWISVVPPATLAFYAAPTGAGQDAGIYLLDSDGSNGRFVHRTTGVINGLMEFGGWPAWSPDARQITFVEGSLLVLPGTPALRILDVAGGAPRDLVTGGIPVSDQRGPQFDRLGRIHFTRGAFGNQQTIWRVPAAGGVAVQESPSSPWGVEAMPSPNPAGDLVAYQTNLVTNSPVEFTLRLLDPATGVVQALDVPGHAPRWSPAGDRIAYLDATNRLQFMSADGAPITSVSAGVSFATGFSWSPDGQWIVGLGATGLQILKVSTREILPLAFSGPQGQALVHPSWRPVP